MQSFEKSRMRKQANAERESNAPDNQNNQSMSPSTAITSLIAFYVIFNNRLRNPPPASPPRVEPVSSISTSSLVAVKLLDVRGHSILKMRAVL